MDYMHTELIDTELKVNRNQYESLLFLLWFVESGIGIVSSQSSNFSVVHHNGNQVLTL